jgi:exoribonuclease R
VEVSACERRSGNKLIEEFMLKANEVIAEHFALLKIPFVLQDP